jgi:hypothetical protein
MKSYAGSLSLAIAIVLSAFLFSNAFKNRNNSSNNISVTGLGSKSFVSDLIVWSGSFGKKSLELKDAYAQASKIAENEGARVGKLKNINIKYHLQLD